MYKHHRTNHSRLLNREFLQKISLCFLIGFLCGAVFYYCFQNSFREILQATLENNTKTWTKETALFTEWFRSLWNHGKYFALIWLLAISPAGPVSQKIFVVYTGIRNGFLFVFFYMPKVHLASLSTLPVWFHKSFYWRRYIFFCFMRQQKTGSQSEEKSRLFLWFLPL